MSIPPEEQFVDASLPGQSRRLKVILTLCGLGLLICMIVWIGPATIWGRLRFIRLPYLIGAMAAIVAGTVLSAINSYLICGASRVMSFLQYLHAFWVAWAVGLVMPGQVGDMLTLTHVLRRRGMALSQSVARTSVDKILSLLCALLVATQLFRLSNAVVLWTFSYGAAMMLLGLLVFLALSLFLLHRLGQFAIRSRWIVGAVATAAEVVRMVIVHPWLILLNMVLSLVKIGLTGISYWLVIAGLTGVFSSLRNTTIAAISSGLIAYLPLSANGIGTVEMAGTGLFGQIGLAADVVLSMYVVLRLVNVLLAWIPSIFVLPDLLRHRKS